MQGLSAEEPPGPHHLALLLRAAGEPGEAAARRKSHLLSPSTCQSVCESVNPHIISQPQENCSYFQFFLLFHPVPLKFICPEVEGCGINTCIQSLKYVYKMSKNFIAAVKLLHLALFT